MDAVKTFTSHARSFFAGTLLSRFSGLGRDIAMAVSFGSTPEIAAFLVSFRLANFFRRLLGEGNVQASFIPQFTSMGDRGNLFFRDSVFSLGLLLIGTITLCEAVAFLLLFFASPDWALIIELAMWMLPGLFFICLSSLNTALLQCRKKHFLPAAAPIFFNLVWIAATFLSPDVRFLAIAVTLAFAAQWAATFKEGARLLSLREWLAPILFSPEFKLLLKPMSLGLIGVGAVQFNSAIDPIFARAADLQGPAYLWYAIRLQQMPLALFAVSLSSALLPTLSSTESTEQRDLLLASSLRRVTIWMTLVTFGIFALGEIGLKLLYGYGQFSSKDLEGTLLCLWGYGIGLLPSAWVLHLAAKCYAEKDYRTPALASLFSVIVNIFLNSLFIFGFGWGAASVALATSFGSLVNAAYLSNKVLDRKFFNNIVFT